jgi:hypothetical protein
MDENYKKEKFETLKIKSSVAKKFRRHCKKMSQSQSMYLMIMLEFFEHNDISPYEDLGPHKMMLANLIKKRFNGLIAIIKNIEKFQTKPTAAMMSSLFEVKAKEEKPLILEKKQLEKKGTGEKNHLKW